MCVGVVRSDNIFLRGKRRDFFPLQEVGTKEGSKRQKDEAKKRSCSGVIVVVVERGERPVGLEGKI